MALMQFQLYRQLRGIYTSPPSNKFPEEFLSLLYIPRMKRNLAGASREKHKKVLGQIKEIHPKLPKSEDMMDKKSKPNL